MTVCDIVDTLPAHVVYGAPGFQELEIEKIVAGDIMSDILVSVETDVLLVTSLATEQTVRSADLVGATVILLVNDKLPLQTMKSLAEECGITLLATPMPMYESCVALNSMRRFGPQTARQ